MAPTAIHLTANEYDRIYGGEAGWEYWFGEARPKPAPTHLHGLLQLVLGELLRLAGYVSSSEAELRNVPDWRPRPDVYGVLGKVEGSYATRPVDVVFEVLSAGEDILEKCRHYSDIHIPQIFVFDPGARTVAVWDGEALRIVVDVKLKNGVTVTGATIWSQLERRQEQEPPERMTI